MVGVDGAVDLDGGASWVKSSVMARTFKVRRSEVWSKQKSRAQTWSGCLAQRRVAGTAETLAPQRFFGRRSTRSPSARHRRAMRLWFTQKPSSRSRAVMRRYP